MFMIIFIFYFFKKWYRYTGTKHYIGVRVTNKRSTITLSRSGHHKTLQHYDTETIKIQNPNSKIKIQKPILKSIILYSLYYAEACNEYAGLIFALFPPEQRNSNPSSYTRCITLKRVTSLRVSSSRYSPPSNVTLLEEVLQWWRAVGDTVSDLTDPRFKPQTSRSKDKRVTARPTGQLHRKVEMRKKFTSKNSIRNTQKIILK